MIDVVILYAVIKSGVTDRQPFSKVVIIDISNDIITGWKVGLAVFVGRLDGDVVGFKVGREEGKWFG